MPVEVHPTEAHHPAEGLLSDPDAIPLVARDDVQLGRGREDQLHDPCAPERKLGMRVEKDGSWVFSHDALKGEPDKARFLLKVGGKSYKLRIIYYDDESRGARGAQRSFKT